jgi:hypothetical protein
VKDLGILDYLQCLCHRHCVCIKNDANFPYAWRIQPLTHPARIFHGQWIHTQASYSKLVVGSSPPIFQKPSSLKISKNKCPPTDVKTSTHFFLNGPSDTQPCSTRLTIHNPPAIWQIRPTCNNFLKFSATIGPEVRQSSAGNHQQQYKNRTR